MKHAEFFADGSISNASPSRVSNTGELHSARVHLFDEIERRKRAEGALARMHSHWRNIRKQLSGVGISFPATRDAGVDTKVEIDDMVEQLCQEVVVGRFVSEAIGRGLARAETEAAAKSLMESKNLEISRIRDKVEYCEAVNREIFQRNQEAVGMSLSLLLPFELFISNFSRQLFFFVLFFWRGVFLTYYFGNILMQK